VRSSSKYKKREVSLLKLGNLDTFPVRGGRPAAGGNTDNRANSAQVQLKLPNGAELGNNVMFIFTTNAINQHHWIVVKA
jgi:hypothetical protein